MSRLRDSEGSEIECRLEILGEPSFDGGGFDAAEDRHALDD
jgi:hypothetical protein